MKNSISNIVFLDPDDINEIPFTTSKVIAEYGEVKHHTVTRLIQNHEEDLKEFGRLRFKIEPFEFSNRQSLHQFNFSVLTTVNLPTAVKKKQSRKKDYFDGKICLIYSIIKRNITLVGVKTHKRGVIYGRLDNRTGTL